MKVIFTAMLFMLIACDNTDTSSTISAENQQRSSKVLVDASWLSEHQNDINVRILDLGQTRQGYLNGHIAKAQFIDWTKDITDPERPELFMNLPKEMLEALLSRLGIDQNSTVILYDNFNSRLSTRMFWTLRYYGHEDIRILDGGRGAWEKAGKEFTTELPIIENSQYVVNHINSNYVTDKSYIESRLGQDNFTLVDGRPFEQYTGEISGKVYHTGTEHQRLGHIYSAQSVPWAQNFKEDGTFKSVAELIKLYHPHDVTADKTVVTYCNEGLHAAPPWFVMTELLGYPDVRLYDASLAEWGNDPDTMLIQGKHCM